MDRREMFGRLGALGAGLTLAPAVAGAVHDHQPAQGAVTPLSGPHAHFCGIHIAKNNPKFQIITQHFCAAHSEDGHGNEMFQCVLFDGLDKNAKLLGVEYIVSDEQYRRLPDGEKKYWHPHTYEVLGGGLIAPGMDEEEERKFMKMVLTTWGKTWHTWPNPADPVPLGEPLLIWSLSGDGQADDALIAKRDAQFNVSTAKIRERRIQELGLEPPQVSLPQSIDSLGRQWRDDGADEPTRRK